MDTKNKKMWILLGVIAVIVIIIIVAALQNKKTTNEPGVNAPATGEQTPATGTETQAPIDLTKNGPTDANAPVNATGTVDMRGAKAEIPGASLVTTDKKVVTADGKIAKNDAIPNTPEAPKPVLVNKDQLTKQVIQLAVGGGKITPNTFTVPTGAPVSLAVSSNDNQVHVFIFTNSAVGAIAMGVGPGETKAITFNAPAVGEYVFRCDVPGHASQGEVGKMIVK
jgi:heme/copper-type cytochrome/quinol oxidase subunit 2